MWKDSLFRFHAESIWSVSRVLALHQTIISVNAWVSLGMLVHHRMYM